MPAYTVAPERIRKWGHRFGATVEGTNPARSAAEIFFWSCPSTFFALKVQLFVLVSAFVMVSTVWWFLIGCFSTHGAPVSSHL